jgi:hypothetical protein
MPTVLCKFKLNLLLISDLLFLILLDNAHLVIDQNQSNKHQKFNMSMADHVPKTDFWLLIVVEEFFFFTLNEIS